MSNEFRTLVTALWASLGLRPPAFSERPHVVLSIDGFDLELSETPDGRHLLVTGRAGTLSAEPGRRIRQVQHLLEFNLAAVASHRACVSLAPPDHEAPAVLVQGLCGYETAGAADAIRIIQDVVAVLETHAPELTSGRDAPARQPRPSDPQTAGEAVIFRP